MRAHSVTIERTDDEAPMVTRLRPFTPQEILIIQEGLRNIKDERKKWAELAQNYLPHWKKDVLAQAWRKHLEQIEKNKVTTERTEDVAPTVTLLRPLTPKEILAIEKGLLSVKDHPRKWEELAKRYLPHWPRKFLSKAWRKHLKQIEKNKAVGTTEMATDAAAAAAAPLRRPWR